MEKSHIAKAGIHINATRAEVWDALVNPVTISKYMFGTEVTSDFTEGSSITWKGEWEGKAYEDKGKILRVDPQKQISYTHFSGMSGLDDVPENYHTIRISLQGGEGNIGVTLEQDNNAGEEAAKESAKNWQHMLESMKKLIEGVS